MWNRDDQLAEPAHGSLVSVGAGVRFQWSRFVDFRCTYGVPLRAPTPGASGTDGASVRFYRQLKPASHALYMFQHAARELAQFVELGDEFETEHEGQHRGRAWVAFAQSQ